MADDDPSTDTAFAYVALRVLYNLFLHPLRHFPGPVLWRVSWIPRHHAAVVGMLDRRLVRLHEQYGDVVRFSPDELSFTSEQAWQDIYVRRVEVGSTAAEAAVPGAGASGSGGLPKASEWYGLVEGKGKKVSILNAGDAVHAKLRKNIASAFSEQAIRRQETVVQHFVDRLRERLRDVASATATAASTTETTDATEKVATDMVRWFNFVMFDIAGALTIGQDFKCLSGADYHPWVKGVFQYIKVRPFIAAAVTFTGSPALVRSFMPKEMKKAKQEHEGYVMKHGLARWDLGTSPERRDLLSFLFKDQAEKSRDEEMKSEFLSNCNFLMRAGSETVATALSGCLYYILRDANIKKTVTREIRDAFKTDSDISFQTTSSQLPYLTACIRETFRLYPSGPGIFPRQVPDGTNVSIAGYIVPGKTVVGVHNLAASTTHANFAQPRDFVPERWLSSRTDGTEASRLQEQQRLFEHDKGAASQIFSMGSRNCIGQALAWNQMRLILAHVLWEFDISICEKSSNWDDQRSYVIWEKHPLWCSVRAARNK